MDLFKQVVPKPFPAAPPSAGLSTHSETLSFLLYTYIITQRKYCPFAIIFPLSCWGDPPLTLGTTGLTTTEEQGGISTTYYHDFLTCFFFFFSSSSCIFLIYFLTFHTLSRDVCPVLWRQIFCSSVCSCLCADLRSDSVRTDIVFF